MKKYSSKNPWWFTLLIILWVIWFLLVLLTGIFKVVTLELKDTRNLDYYLKSKWAAEGSQELALLKLKEEKFWYDGDVAYDPINPREDESLILAGNPNDKDKYHENKDVSLGYSIDSKASSYVWILEQWDFEVIPLFIKEDGQDKKATMRPNVSILDTEATDDGTLGAVISKNDFIWNIIWEIDWEPVWISGKSVFNADTEVKIKKLAGWGAVWCDWQFCQESSFTINDISVADFLDQSTDSYLTIFNKGSYNLEYTVSTDEPSGDDEFTKPITIVTSQAKIWEIKQNIELTIDNAQYFDVLKYSLYDAE